MEYMENCGIRQQKLERGLCLRPCCQGQRLDKSSICQSHHSEFSVIKASNFADSSADHERIMKILRTLDGRSGLKAFRRLLRATELAKLKSAVYIYLKMNRFLIKPKIVIFGTCGKSIRKAEVCQLNDIWAKKIYRSMLGSVQQRQTYLGSSPFGYSSQAFCPKTVEYVRRRPSTLY